MDFKIKLNIKSICLYEQMTGDNFLMFNSNNILELMYCVIIANNDFDYSFETFKTTYEFNKKFRMEIEKMVNKLLIGISNFKTDKVVKKEDSGDMPKLSMCDVASSLIILHNIDAHYVMYEMDIWEINNLFAVAEEKKHSEMVDKRFWSFVQLAPYLPKDIKKPSDLITFEWEKEDNKNAALKDLEKNKEMILKTFEKWETT